jgi:predicted TPR repeat methyltransferase
MTGQSTSIPARDQHPLRVIDYLSADAPVSEDAARAALLRHSGLQLWLDRRFDEAVRAFREAAKFAPEDSRILAELGSLLSATRENAEARQCLLASLKLNPQEPQTWLSLAALDTQSGNKRGAEDAFVEALRINPNCKEALTGLGLLHFELRRFRSAARLLSSALQFGAVSMPVYACLGETQYILGQFSQAAWAFEKAAEACPNEKIIIQKFARTRLIETILADSVASAIEVYRSIAGDDAAEIAAACREAFKALAGYGHAEAAVRLGRALLDKNPEDPVISYHVDALTGKTYGRTPDAYLTVCFDHYAPHFDKHLVETLKYDLPSRCGALLRETGQVFSNILDLGCGTGLAAPHLAPLGSELTGVDISSRMLEKAEERGLYNCLHRSEAIAYLTGCARQFSLIVALDVLVYFGDLSEMFACASGHLTPDGVFAISFETGNHEKFRLQPSGRFSHSPAYIQTLCGASLVVIADIATTIRLEADAAVEGRLMLLRRRREGMTGPVQAVTFAAM